MPYRQGFLQDNVPIKIVYPLTVDFSSLAFQEYQKFTGCYLTAFSTGIVLPSIPNNTISLGRDAPAEAVGLICKESLLAKQDSCHNTEATDNQQRNPHPQHIVISGLRATGICRRCGYAYIVSANITLAICVFVLVRRCVGLITARTLIPMVIFIGLPIGAVSVGMAKEGTE